MVVLNKIYTKTGDKGQTSLVDGTRTPKDALRVEVYGTVDELNATLGMARLHAGAAVRAVAGAGAGAGDLTAALERIQNDLFDLGADLGRPDPERDGEAGYPVLRIIASQTTRLEREIDGMIAVLEPLRTFVLPGGSALSAHLHLSRTVARRAERLGVGLAQNEAVNTEALRYLNRLSDWLFVAARIANDCGKSDILWHPGATRDDSQTP